MTRKTRKPRVSYTQRKARKEAWQTAGLCVGFVIALPFFMVIAGSMGDAMAKTNYTGAALRALVQLVAA